MSSWVRPGASISTKTLCSSSQTDSGRVDHTCVVTGAKKSSLKKVSNSEAKRLTGRPVVGTREPLLRITGSMGNLLSESWVTEKESDRYSTGRGRIGVSDQA